MAIIGGSGNGVDNEAVVKIKQQLLLKLLLYN